MKNFIVFVMLMIFLAVLNVSVSNALDITGKVTYTGNVTINDDINIKANSRLVVTGNLKMGTGKGIFVEKYGVLIVDGGTISHVDGTSLWLGIIARGTSNSQQRGDDRVFTNDNIYPQDGQPYVYLKDAVISFALGAVTMGDRGMWNALNLWGFFSGHGGGYLQANNTLFLNNFGWSVALSGYKGVNLSCVKNCTFTVTQNSPITIPSNIPYHYFIKIQDEHFVCGVFSSGNVFTRGNNTDPFGAFLVCNGSRISFDSDFPVGQCVISNMDVGMHFYQPSVKTSYSVVGRVLFENNIEAIRVDYNDLVNLRRNEIKLKSDANKQTYGIYLNECTGFMVWDNEFLKMNGTINNASGGVFVNKSGKKIGNEIRENIFTSIPQGIQAQQDNLGLQLYCNTYNSVGQYNIAVTSGGIASPQGTLNKPANNEFSNIGTYPTSDFHQNQGVSSVTYYYNASPLRCDPYYNSSTVNKTLVAGTKDNCYLYLPLIDKKDKVWDISEEIGTLNPVIDAELINYLTVKRDVLITEIIGEYFTGNRIETDSSVTWEWNYPQYDLIQFLENEDYFSAKYYLCGIYIENGEYTNAGNLLNELRYEFPEDEDVLTFCDYADYMIIADSLNYDLDYLISIEDDIEIIANNTTLVSGKAKGLMQYLIMQKSIEYGHEYEELYPLVFEEIVHELPEVQEIVCTNISNTLDGNKFISIQNITNREVTINNTEFLPIQVSLYDMTGKVVVSDEFNSAEHVMHIEGLPTGVYLLIARDLSSEILIKHKIFKHK